MFGQIGDVDIQVLVCKRFKDAGLYGSHRLVVTSTALGTGSNTGANVRWRQRCIVFEIALRDAIFSGKPDNLKKVYTLMKHFLAAFCAQKKRQRRAKMLLFHVRYRLSCAARSWPGAMHFLWREIFGRKTTSSGETNILRRLAVPWHEHPGEKTAVPLLVSFFFHFDTWLRSCGQEMRRSSRLRWQELARFPQRWPSMKQRPRAMTLRQHVSLQVEQ